jgi:hypothetical protein
VFGCFTCSANDLRGLVLSSTCARVCVVRKRFLRPNLGPFRPASVLRRARLCAVRPRGAVARVCVGAVLLAQVRSRRAVVWVGVGEHAAQQVAPADALFRRFAAFRGSLACTQRALGTVELQR